MGMPRHERYLWRFRRASFAAGALAAALGTTVLCGWAGDIAVLTSLRPGYVSMKANTAFALLLLGVALCLLQERPAQARLRAGAGRLMAALAALLGALTLAEYFLGAHLGIDQLLFRDVPDAVKTAHPGRMAPDTALCLMMLGLAMLALDLRAPRVCYPPQVLAATAFCVALIPFSGYLYGVSEFVVTDGAYTAMAIHTSAAFLLLSAGVLFARPNRGWMLLASSGGSAGVTMRVLFPLTLLALVLLGWLRVAGQQAGLYTSEYGTTLFVVVRLVLICGIVVWVARVVHRLERQRTAAQKELERANASLEERVALRTAEIEAAHQDLKRERDFVAKVMDMGGAMLLVIDRDGCIVRFNRACEETTGYTSETAHGRNFRELFFEADEYHKVRELLRGVFENDEPFCGGDAAWRTSRGQIRWIHWHGSGLRETGEAITHCVIAGVDLTKNHLAEERLRENEERMRAILGHLPVGVLLSSGADQTLTYQNPRFAEFFGYTLEDFRDMAALWPLVIPEPGYRESVAGEWNRRIAGAAGEISDIEPMEISVTARDGSTKYMSVHVAALGDMNFITFIDLTERRRVELARGLDEMRLEALLKLNQMTRASLQELTDFVLEEAVRLTGSRIGYLAFMNEDESVLTMYSWSRTAMKQCEIQDKPIVYPVHETGLWGEAVRQRRPVITNDYQAPNPLKKGYPEGHVPVLRHMNIPVMDETRIVAVAGVGNKEEPYDESDVRQLTLLMEGMWRILVKRRTEEAMKRMRAYLQNIVDSMPSVLVGVDPQGAVTHWNREAARLTGLSEADTRGRDLGDVLPQLKDQLDNIRAAIRDGRAVENERLAVHDGQEELQYYDLMVFPLIANGAQGAVVRLDDVTSRVQIEEMMVQTEKMMSVGGLAAGMAHEINNPLGGILQACQNIERRTSLELAKNAEVAQAIGVDIALVHRYLEERNILEFVAGIRSDGARAAQIVSDMLAFSRRSESRLAPASLEEMVETVLRLAANDYDLKKQYDFRSIEVLRDFEPDMPLVQCDKTKIEQVMLNLVKNAAQALATHDRVRPPLITVRIRKEPHYARIEVLDNGPGMPEAVRRRVFEPFFTTKEVGIGTGLGLSVSYFIVTRQHKGSMSVESAPGEGSRFMFRLPLRAEG